MNNRNRILEIAGVRQSRKVVEEASGLSNYYKIVVRHLDEADELLDELVDTIDELRNALSTFDSDVSKSEEHNLNQAKTYLSKHIMPILKQVRTFAKKANE